MQGAKVAILGFTFKENCPDTRNTKIWDIVKELREYGIVPDIFDPIADKEEAKRLYSIDFKELNEIQDIDTVILAVAHEQFSNYTVDELNGFYGDGRKILIDLKGLLSKATFENAGYYYWRL